MTHLQLQPHVSYGLPGGRPVFLDLLRDRYVALDATAEDAFRQVRATRDPDPTDSASEVLLATGLFRLGGFRGSLSEASVTAPPASILDESPRHRRGFTALPRVWAAVSRSRKQLARRPLIEIVGAIRKDRSKGPPARQVTSIEEAARAFQVARALVPIDRSCLLDSLALLDWLGDAARHAELVFGVRVNPFGAHCWIQTERLLLTDANDTIGGFVPVLSV